MYMSGFFPCMMFGVLGAALAMVKTAKNKKAAIGLVLSAAICAFVCGVTEPFEFGFMFLCFPLYVVYAALYGIFTVITYYSGFRAGFCFSAGATDLVFSASLPAAAKTWMIIPLGIAAFVVFYAVFYFAITKFDLKTPGREDEDEESEKKVVLANNNYTEVASAVLAAVGGKENVKDVGYCATRLRFEVKDNAKVDEKAVKAAGAAGVIRPSKNCLPGDHRHQGPVRVRRAEEDAVTHTAFRSEPDAGDWLLLHSIIKLPPGDGTEPVRSRRLFAFPHGVCYTGSSKTGQHLPGRRKR